MAKSIPALVEPRLLVWARESARLSLGELAERLKVSGERITAWEAGAAHPSVAQLRKLAKAVRRPVAVFFLPEPPRDFEALRDFRRTTVKGAPSVSPELEAELYRAQELRAAALTLADEDDTGAGAAFPVTATQAEDPEMVGGRLRAVLDVSYEAQRGWRDSYQALDEWRTAVEALGVLVINMRGIEVEDARGFSIAAFPWPLVALNTRDAANGRIFTLMHELTHLALREGGICDWKDERHLAPTDRVIETFCNRVASAVLLPRDLVEQTTAGAPAPRADGWPDALLRTYARRLCVSEESLLLRLVQLGRASQAFYVQKRDEYRERYALAATKKSKPVVPYERVIVGRLGTAYLDLAFSAYYAQRLTLSELSSYTGVRVDNLGKVEREAFGITRVPGVSA
jgi:Zn-dependent peptidase ImmA (M78 family)/transcriptional regulator with XRE-family HTH domain